MYLCPSESFVCRISLKLSHLLICYHTNVCPTSKFSVVSSGDSTTQLGLAALIWMEKGDLRRHRMLALTLMLSAQYGVLFIFRVG